MVFRIINQVLKKSSVLVDKFCFFICKSIYFGIIRSMKRKTIRAYKDFLTSKDDLWGRARYFVVKTKLAKYPKDPRYGIIVSKRVFKAAVDRNRAKRLLRDWIFFNEKYMLDKFDYIFIIGKDILGASRDEGRKATRRVLRRIIRHDKKNGFEK